MKKRTFSKIAFVALTVLYVIVVAFAFIMTWRTGDMECLRTIIVGASAVMAFVIKYYYRKAEQENKIKLMKSYGIDPTREDFTPDGGDIYGN